MVCAVYARVPVPPGGGEGARGTVGTPSSSVSKSEAGYYIAACAGLPGSACGSPAEVSPKPRRNVRFRRLVGASLNGHEGAAARLIRLREGAVTLPVLALLRAQA